MFSANPFAALAEFLPAGFMQVYVVLMAIAVFAGTLFDVLHKGSAQFFDQRREDYRTRAKRRLGGGEKLSCVAATVAEAAVSGEFCKWPRRASHLLMMYGFITYIAATVVMVFRYPDGGAVPAILPTLWTLGALSILAGGLWFFFFLRVNVAYDGASPFHVGRADIFVGSLLLGVAFGLAGHFMQTSGAGANATRIVFGIYLFFTALLFLTVPWSKFAHMFFKPAVAYQRRVEDAEGSSDLPSPAIENHIVRS